MVKQAARRVGGSACETMQLVDDVVRGDATPSGWASNGRDVLAGVFAGGADGLVSRLRDRSPARNPYGVSDRADRAVTRYDECTEHTDR
mgnify:CR=1 FL=1